MTEFPTLNHEQPTMQHAIVAILEYVRATAPHRDDEQLQYFLVVDEGDWVQILSIDAGTWPDFGDGGLQAITGLAHALQAAGAVVVERGSHDTPVRVDVHLRGQTRGFTYLLRLNGRDDDGHAPGFEVSVSNHPFDIVPSGDGDGFASPTWARLDAVKAR